MIWAVFALVTFAALGVLLYPLLRAPGALGRRIDYDLAVYRSQLAEVEDDVEHDVLAPAQAGDVRSEIQRRMLRVAETPGVAVKDDPGARRIAAIVIAVMVPLGAGLFYAAHGHPDQADRPYAERLEHDPAVILAHAAEDMERELAARPSARGYKRLAQLYMTQHDFAHAAASLRRAIRLGDDDASTWGEMGEAYVLAASGVVSPPALEAFAHALTLDAREPRARFYAGLAEAEIGNSKGAVAIWRDLERDSKSDAPWLPVLQQQIAITAKLGKFDPASVPPEPPSAAALTAAIQAMNRAMAR